MEQLREPGARSAFVTGVSSGIGQGIVRSLLRKGYAVFGSVRSETDGQAASSLLGHGFEPILMDVTDADSVIHARDIVAERLDGRPLAALVNSAGVAIAGPLLHQSAEAFARHLDINVTGAFHVTQAFAPLLGADGRPGERGRIVLISSIAGEIATPFLGAYAASKHALEGFADALRRELVVHGIDVVVVGPGAVATPIWDKASAAAVSGYEETPYAAAMTRLLAGMVARGRAGLPADAVGNLVARILAAPHPRARYAILRNPIAGWHLPRAMTRRMLDRSFARRLGLVRVP